MIFVDRGDEEPTSLASGATLRQAQVALEYYTNWSPGDPAFDAFTRYREYDVKLKLRTLFHGKCAYCEKQIEKGAAEVEHYRPKGRIEGSEHPGYWWLALKWTNLLPTCPGCNKGMNHHLIMANMSVAEVEAIQASEPRTLMGKACHFPIGAQRLGILEDDHFSEDPHIIDPTRTDPSQDLKWSHHADYSVVESAPTDVGCSIRGLETIRCVGLNRLDLVQSRTAVLNRLKTNRARIMEDLENEFGPDIEPALLEIHLHGAKRRVQDMKRSSLPDQPFSAMANAFIAAFEDELEAWIDERLAEG